MVVGGAILSGPVVAMAVKGPPPKPVIDYSVPWQAGMFVLLGIAIIMAAGLKPSRRTHLD